MEVPTVCKLIKEGILIIAVCVCQNSMIFMSRNRSVKDKTWDKIPTASTFHTKPLLTIGGGLALVSGSDSPA